MIVERYRAGRSTNCKIRSSNGIDGISQWNGADSPRLGCMQAPEGSSIISRDMISMEPTSFICVELLFASPRVEIGVVLTYCGYCYPCFTKRQQKVA